VAAAQFGNVKRCIQPTHRAPGLRDVANEMEIEEGVIWVYGVGEDGIQAFTDFGI